jgi:hypothetical protein
MRTLLVAAGCALACQSPSTPLPDAGHSHHDSLAHCQRGAVFPADSRDGPSLSWQTVETPNGRDIALPDAMLDWLDEQGWPQQHDDWHNIRRWDQGCRRSNAPADNCNAAKRLLARGLWRSPRQENAPGDGYDFLVMHRHMLIGMRQAFPNSAELLRGFRSVPLLQSDAENPTPWRSLSWTMQARAAIGLLENIEQHADEFATEDELARFMQASFVWTPESPTAPGRPNGGIHFSLHAQWSVRGSPVELGNGPTVIYNAVFWRLHGWLDDVWERFRITKGIGHDDPLYVQTLFEQCKEMHDLDLKNLTPHPEVLDAGTTGTGVFGTTVRPILERTCATCHGAIAPTLGLTVGGSGVSNEEIIKSLVNVKAVQVDMPLVSPQAPEQSWLYLKAAGTFDQVTCVSGTCKTLMPPAGQRLTDGELTTLRNWILAGATAN